MFRFRGALFCLPTDSDVFFCSKSISRQQPWSAHGANGSYHPLVSSGRRPSKSWVNANAAIFALQCNSRFCSGNTLQAVLCTTAAVHIKSSNVLPIEVGMGCNKKALTYGFYISEAFKDGRATQIILRKTVPKGVAIDVEAVRKAWRLD